MAKKTTTKTPAKKTTATAKTTTARKATVRKAAAHKATPKVTSKPKSSAKPAAAHEEKLTSSALKLVDEAAALLRKGIKTTADVSEKNREEARKRAHSLLTKATSSLNDLLDSGTSALHKAISKL
jgi:DNA-binding protein HU-beta